MTSGVSPYIGRFAPSPTGPLHEGSLVAALASWLDARAHGGRWLVRLEDVDTLRCVPGADHLILSQLAACGLLPDGEVLWQSRRHAAYQRALEQLQAQQQAYPCTCTRAAIAAWWEAQGVTHERHQERVYPGTCRPTPGHPTAPPRHTAGEPQRAAAWRLKVPTGPAARWSWTDRALGPQTQDLEHAVGDFILRRSDGLWAYQLAVVVDDAEQGVTHVVRGQDLADNTPRQQWLAHCLNLPRPSHLHTPLVMAGDGHKLSKQNGAQPLDLSDPTRVMGALRRAAARLALPPVAEATPSQWLARCVSLWQDRWGG